jgi:predicted ATPase/class 3 adenylate cyclase
VRDLPSGTVTFLFTDIEGSTRMLHELGDGYRAVLTEHRRALRAAFGEHGGVEVDTQGDAFFVAFANAADAVAAAAEAQRALRDGPVRVRMGIHTGQPTLTDEGYIGLDVHRGARVCAAGHGGQVLISRTTRESLSADVDVIDLGEHRLKDLKSPEWLFQLSGPGLEIDFPPLKSLSNTNLPAEASSLIGRERELAELSALLTRDTVRLLTLTGPGGTGKTRLALRLAARSVEHFKNGVFFVALAAVQDPELVLATVAQTLGVKQVGAEPLADSLGDHLVRKSVLLVLDNFEQLLSAAPQVAHVLRLAPDLKVVMTSRERLHLDGEHEYGVQPLASDDARELFYERALAAGRSIEADEDRAAVSAICERLDGLPLAVELAAARVSALSPRALLARLEQRLPLLVGGARDLPARQRTLRTTIDWSHGFLSARDQRVFADLGVFSGGFTPEAALATFQVTLEELSALRDKSLLRHQDGPGGEPRFSMLETIREYALERLVEGGGADKARALHAALYTQLIAVDQAARQHPAKWRQRIRPEQENIRSALTWLTECGDAGMAVRLVLSMWSFWMSEGQLREGRTWTERILSLPGVETSERYSWFLTIAGEFPRFQGDFERAKELKERALARFRQATPQDSISVAAILHDLGSIAESEGDFARARALHEEALILRRAVGTPGGIAHALNGLTNLALREKDYVHAEALAAEELELCRIAIDPDGAANAQVSLGDARRNQGKLSSAAKAYQDALSSAPADVLIVAESLDGLAHIAAAAGDMVRATQVWSASRRVFDDSTLRPFNPDAAEAGVARARAVIGPAAFEETWRAGQVMSREAVAAIVGEIAASVEGVDSSGQP